METTLKAHPREGSGKGPARRLRAEGLVPAVLYGHGMAPQSLAVTGPGPGPPLPCLGRRFR